jgi:hypothetical protein
MQGFLIRLLQLQMHLLGFFLPLKAGTRRLQINLVVTPLSTAATYRIPVELSKQPYE